MPQENPTTNKENLDRLKMELATKIAKVLSGKDIPLSTEGWIEPRPDWLPDTLNIKFNESPLRGAIGGYFSFVAQPGGNEKKYFNNVQEEKKNQLKPDMQPGFAFLYNMPTQIPLHNIFKTKEIFPEIIHIVENMDLDKKTKGELLKSLE